jgi:hypothetical protein
LPRKGTLVDFNPPQHRAAREIPPFIEAGPGRVLSAIYRAERMVLAWKAIRWDLVDLRRTREYRWLLEDRAKLVGAMRGRELPARPPQTLYGPLALALVDRRRTDPYADRYEDEEWFRDPGEWWK